jgi:hypothetical protein
VEQPSNLSNLTSNLENSLGKSLDVSGGDTSDGDTAVLGGVDGVLLGKDIHLLRREACVCEHTNLDIISVSSHRRESDGRKGRGAYLVGNMRPVMLTTQSLKVLLEKTAHLNDTVSHTLDFAQPLLLEFGIVQDGGCDTGAVDRRVGVEGANEDFDLRVDALLFLGGGADE